MTIDKLSNIVRFTPHVDETKRDAVSRCFAEAVEETHWNEYFGWFWAD